MTSVEIDAAIGACIALQSSIGCEAIILPAPLTAEASTDYSSELTWMDTGLSLAEAQQPGAKRFVTIAISDSCLRGQDPWSNQLLDLILDQVTARRPEGVYVLVEAANESGYYLTHPNTVGALMRLSFSLKQGGIEEVLVCFAGTAGLLALVAGADAWSAGWYRGERRLKLVDFEEQVGMAVPTFYSHKLASEIHTDRDLDRVNEEGLLPQVADITSASAGLMRALGGGRTVASVPEWRYRKSNVAAAREHFLAVAVRETHALVNLDFQGRIDYAHRWLSEADELATRLQEIGGFNQRTELRHQATWLQALVRFAREAS